jgi:hypothetical protein
MDGAVLRMYTASLDVAKKSTVEDIYLFRAHAGLATGLATMKTEMSSMSSKHPTPQPFLGASGTGAGHVSTLLDEVVQIVQDALAMLARLDGLLTLEDLWALDREVSKQLKRECHCLITPLNYSIDSLSVSLQSSAKLAQTCSQTRCDAVYAVSKPRPHYECDYSQRESCDHATMPLSW